MPTLCEQSSRIALAAFLHDMGKFAERARIDVNKETLEINKQMYCPHRKAFTDATGYFTHVHAAYTAVAMDLLERKFPELKGEDMSPFSAWMEKDADDSLINAAARHHKPDSFLQWVIATADRVASGFERDEFEEYNQAEEGRNHYTARQLTLLEQIDLDGTNKPRSKDQLKYRYALKPLSPNSLFPVEAKGYETADRQQAQKEYRKLWNDFMDALDKIPPAHRKNLSLWLDHFETLWGAYTHAIPSATIGKTRPEVSLYDHSRTTAALAAALWRYHHETGERGKLNEQWEKDKFLLIQGDFFGIQDFIFASGGETSKCAAKLLRGRSFYVSLLTECAALKVLDSLQLPPTSQVINAAGKFLIVAPNTPETIEKLESVQQELDKWFLQTSWGQSGIGLAWQGASCNDFISRPRDGGDSGFKQLIAQLFMKLDEIKHQRLHLCTDRPPVVFSDYLDSFDNEKGVCQIDGRSPARHLLDNEAWISTLAKIQMDCGDYLVKYDRLLISTENLDHHTLEMPVFGYFLSFTKGEEVTGKFGKIAVEGTLRRVWDFSLPQTADGVLWNGYARRNINAYVPRFDATAEAEAELGRYHAIKEDIDPGGIKTLNHLAYDDRTLDEQHKWVGEVGLMTLKGDIDNLGLMFQRGLGEPSFSKMASLSRQVNSFFAIYLPWLCQSEPRFRNTYTVFAGGDDFFLIGPWRSTLELARVMRERFTGYVAINPQVHFSVGMAMTKPGLPVPQLAKVSEDALDRAKEHNPDKAVTAPKNAVYCFNQSMFWEEYDALSERADRLDELKQSLNLSTGYIYGLLKLVDMKEQVGKKPQNAIWHSYFAYRTRRMLERTRGLDEAARRRKQGELADEIAGNGIERHGGNYRVALFTHLYKHRH